MWRLVLMEILYWIVMKWLKAVKITILTVLNFFSQVQKQKSGVFFTNFTTLNQL